MSATPLSDKISTLINSSSPLLVSDLEQLFLNSSLGLVLQNLPPPEQSDKYLVKRKDNIICKIVGDPDGNPMIKACADPEVFEQNYKEGINALMTGREILEMLVKQEYAQGVLICSATSFNSFPLYKDRANQLLSYTIPRSLPKPKW